MARIRPPAPAPPPPALVALPAWPAGRLAGALAWGDDLARLGRRPPDWLLTGLMERGDLVLLTGREKLGHKTWCVLDLAIAVLIGHEAEWLGHRTTTSAGRVLVVSAETSAAAIARRVEALCAGRGLPAARIFDRLLVLDQPLAIEPAEEREGVLDADGDVAPGLLDEIEDAPQGAVALVVVDTVRACMRGNENSSEDMGRFTRGARELARRLNAPVVCVHHTGKGGEPGDARGARGSTELTAAVDVLLTIDTSGEHPTVHALLRNHESPQPFGFSLERRSNGGFALERRAPAESARSARRAFDDEEVIEVLRRVAPAALTETKIRAAISDARGGREGSKYAAEPVRRSLRRLVERGHVAEVAIAARGKSFPGFRLGADRSPDVARRIEVAGVGQAEDV